MPPGSFCFPSGKLLAWYDAHRRDLPWRQTRDPYFILVSEIMLQQTQVDRVIPKYGEFLTRFPTLAALAAAPVGNVIRAWAPLGYNRRAVRLHGIAREVMARHGGQIPSDAEELRQLEGIGAYTAAAIAAFAFGRPVAAVDTNLRRVLGRLLWGQPHAPEGRVRLATAGLVPADRPGDWNQALMDVGATICVAREPACLICPLRDECAYAAGPRQLHEAAPEWQAAPRRARTSVRPAERFVGSRRYHRGRVVEHLRGLAPGETIAVDALARALAPERDPADGWLTEILAGLAGDGLVRLEEWEGERYVALP